MLLGVVQSYRADMSTIELGRDAQDTAADLWQMPPCTSELHASGLHGHVPSEDAAYLVGAPCGLSWFACAGWVETACTVERIACELHGAHPRAAHTFVPLT